VAGGKTRSVRGAAVRFVSPRRYSLATLQGKTENGGSSLKRAETDDPFFLYLPHGMLIVPKTVAMEMKSLYYWDMVRRRGSVKCLREMSE